MSKKEKSRELKNKEAKKDSSGKKKQSSKYISDEEYLHKYGNLDKELGTQNSAKEINEDAFQQNFIRLLNLDEIDEPKQESTDGNQLKDPMTNVQVKPPMTTDAIDLKMLAKDLKPIQTLPVPPILGEDAYKDSRPCYRPSSLYEEMRRGLGFYSYGLNVCKRCGKLNHATMDCPEFLCNICMNQHHPRNCPQRNRCQLCGGSHFTRDCPQYARSWRRRCHCCHRLGHTAAECRRRLNGL